MRSGASDFVKKIIEIALSVDAGLKPIQVLVSILGGLKEFYWQKYDLHFTYSTDEDQRHKQTLSSWTEEKKIFNQIKSSTIGASSLRYFMSKTETISQSRAIQSQLEYVICKEDKDLKKLMPKLREELGDLKIELNSGCFFGKAGVHAIPDGTVLIDGVVCPVELYTSKEAMRLFGESTKAENRQRSRTQKNAKERQARAEEKRLRKARFTSLEKAKIKKAEAEWDPDHDSISEKKEKKVPNVFPANRSSFANLSALTSEDRSVFKADKMSIAQSNRRHVETLDIPEISEMTEFQNQKMTQLQCQMYCMNAHKGLGIHWTGSNIHYRIYDFKIAMNMLLLTFSESGFLSPEKLKSMFASVSGNCS